MGCDKKLNKDKCPCPETGCDRRGACCECISYHLGSGGQPYCVKQGSLK